MRVNREHLVPTNALFVGFEGTKVYPLGAATLPVIVGDYPQQITKDVTFIVVNFSFTYNAIIWQPTLNSWKATTSTYHLMIKFPTEYGVREMRGDQMAVRECYIAILEMDKHLQTMSIEEQKTGAKLIERLEEIPLNSSRLDRTTRIGTLANPMVRQALIAFLKENQDVFTWSHKDMPGIDPSIMVHKLNVSPFFPPVSHKQRVLAQEQDRAIAEEVGKL